MQAFTARWLALMSSRIQLVMSRAKNIIKGMARHTYQLALAHVANVIGAYLDLKSRPY
jgi:hypothetical protein